MLRSIPLAMAPKAQPSQAVLGWISQEGPGNNARTKASTQMARVTPVYSLPSPAPSTLLLHVLDTEHNRDRGTRDHSQVCDHQIHQLQGGHIVDQIEEAQRFALLPASQGAPPLRQANQVIRIIWRHSKQKGKGLGMATFPQAAGPTASLLAFYGDGSREPSHLPALKKQEQCPSSHPLT